VTNSGGGGPARSYVCPLTWAMDGRIVRYGIISSTQSTATSEIVKRLWSQLYRVSSAVPLLLPLRFGRAVTNARNTAASYVIGFSTLAAFKNAMKHFLQYFPVYFW